MTRRPRFQRVSAKRPRITCEGADGQRPAATNRAGAVVRCMRMLHAALLEEFDELRNRQSRLSNDGSQGSLCDFLVVRNGHPSEWRIGIPENHVTAILTI